MSARHPDRRRLQRWLDTGEPRRVSKHIESCALCQQQLDEISALDDGLVADLQAATSPPEDLRERTHGGVDLRLRDEAALGGFLDLFAVGWDFARSILDPQSSPGAPTDGDGPHPDAGEADERRGEPR